MEVILIGTLVTGVVAYGLWRERKDENPGRKREYDGNAGYAGDAGTGSGGGWFRGLGSDCSSGDGGGGCGGGGGD